VNRPDQLLERERLADGGVRELPRGLAEADAPGEEGDRHLRAALAQGARDLQPVVDAQVEVEDDDGDVLRPDETLEIPPTRGLLDAVALELEVHPAEQANGVVVVGDDDQAADLGVHPGRV
jgi:hypothetical protein